MTALSNKSAREAQPGDVIRCHVVKGLALYVGRTGAKTWKLRYVVGGQDRRPKLGDFPALSVEDAREIARDWRKRLANGEDPSAARIRARQAPTVAEFAATFFAEYAPTHYRAETLRASQGAIARDVLPFIGRLKVADVTAADVRGVLARIEARGKPVAMNRTRAYLSKLFSVAESDLYGLRPAGSNPCRGPTLPKGRERRRRVWIEPDQFPAIFEALDRQADRWPERVAAIYVGLFTGARVTEPLQIMARDVRPDGVAILHEHKTSGRTGDVREIRLPRQALDLIARLPLYPCGRLFGATTWDNLSTVWDHVRADAGVPDLQLRDLRRTFASVCASVGYTVDDASRLMGHTSGKITSQRYAFLFRGRSHDIVQGVADAMEGFAGREPPTISDNASRTAQAPIDGGRERPRALARKRVRFRARNPA